MNAATFSALAEPNRVNILELLRDFGELTVGEIAQRLGLRMPQSSKHLHVLANAGLVNVKADANRRIYSIRQESFEEMDQWFESFIREKEEQFNRFEELLIKKQATEKRNE
ncbi:metalloregulator ArsR/SmtB family transcription factor [Sediminibacillus dalangtanensis]|uniref:Metalloregulator ArsR/SmtB family transcription factor n=1 Tax=Sediminibacillus dalangtanensis TaxID=2729421 RepID=A0ABX7VW22_9BACI|nr:metalloregulator ArsR/SmtB family transcription factor [Sediminibacillus dalangtanensis]QTN00744.1 metalloregulator ArsR/SmtB family transcription factor [Sediminibacillus dalangtanensis]